MSKKVKWDQKSGTDFKGEYLTMNGGLPPKKSVEAIDKANTPKKAPNSTGK